MKELMKQLFNEQIDNLNISTDMKTAVKGIYESTIGKAEVTEDMINSAREKAIRDREMAMQMQSYAEKLVYPVLEDLAMGLSHDELRDKLIQVFKNATPSIQKTFGDDKVDMVKGMALKTIKRKAGTNIDLRI